MHTAVTGTRLGEMSAYHKASAWAGERAAVRAVGGWQAHLVIEQLLQRGDDCGRAVTELVELGAELVERRREARARAFEVRSEALGAGGRDKQCAQRAAACLGLEP